VQINYCNLNVSECLQIRGKFYIADFCCGPPTKVLTMFALYLTPSFEACIEGMHSIWWSKCFVPFLDFPPSNFLQCLHSNLLSPLTFNLYKMIPYLTPKSACTCLYQSLYIISSLTIRCLNCLIWWCETNKWRVETSFQSRN
jgi:hypothetical protein